MITILLTLIILLSVFIEATVTTLPVVLICLLYLIIIKREVLVFPLAFISGLLLDVVTLRAIGGTSIFFLTFVFFMLMYQRKYEIHSYQFVMLSAFSGALLFLWLFGYEQIWLQSGMSALLAGVLFGIVRLVNGGKGNGETANVKGSYSL